MGTSACIRYVLNRTSRVRGVGSQLVEIAIYTLIYAGWFFQL